MQPAAWVLLAVYGAVALVLLPRELQFLASVKGPQKASFIAQDILLQVCVLLVLVPSALSKSWSLVSVTLVMIGFTLLWIVAAWMAFSRRRYVNQLLEESRREGAELLDELARKIREHQLQKEDQGE